MSTSSSRSGLVLELAEEFLERYRRGERPSLKEYIDRHPSLAGEIRAVFPAMAMMEKVALSDEAPTGDAAVGASSPRPPRVERLGDFRILREVGRGGMGVVYEAEQVSLGRHVALKVLPESRLRDPRQRPRFEREARAAARLHHTNIVPVFGVGEHEGTPYYVMQFIQGRGLDEVLDELKRLRDRPAGGDPGTAGVVTADVLSSPGRDVSAAAVARSLLIGRFDTAPVDPGSDPLPPTLAGTATFAPATTEGEPSPGPPPEPDGLDRRSDPVSPSSSSVSLLGSGTGTGPSGVGRSRPARRPTYWQGVARLGVQVAEALEYAHKQGIFHRDVKPSNLLLDTRGTVWVTDFGLAKASDQQDLTHTGDLLGTLRYMPPEAFEGRADHRGDIYALGLTLYELLAFRPAFGERDRNRLVRQVTTEEPARLGSLNPEVPRDLETIVHKAIDRDPAHRYASAGALAADLQRFLDDEAIQARRQTQVERCRRWARRNPGIAVLGGLLTAVLVLATAASLVVAGRMSRLAEQQARAARAAEQARRHEAEQRAVAVAARRQAETSASEADAERRRAEANFARARRAVDDFFTQVSETRLLTAPGLQPLRLDLLSSALAFYEEFLKERGDDPSLRSELLATRFRVADILNELGRPGEAKKATQAALDGYAQALRGRPGDPDLKAGLAEALARQAGTVADHDSKVEAWRRVVAIREELLQARTDDARFKRDLARAYNDLGIALPVRDREERMGAYQRCVDLRLELADARPDDPSLQADLAQSFNNIAAALSVRGDLHGDLPQQAALYRQALEFARAVAQREPQSQSAARLLCATTTNTAMVYIRMGRHGDLIGEYQKTLDFLRRQVRDNPDVPGFRTLYLQTARQFRNSLRPLGRRDESERVRQAAMAVLEGMPRQTASDLYALAREEAAFAQSDANASDAPSPDDPRRSAELADRAMATLQQAVDAGWRDPGPLRSDPELFRLRRRDEFKALLARLDGMGAPQIGGPPRTDPARDSADRGGSPAARRTLESRATVRYTIGMLYSGLDKADRAVPPLSEALRLRERLAEADPENPRYQIDLALALIGLGDLDQKTGRADGARRRWERAEAILSRLARARPGDAWLWMTLGRLHAELGRAVEAAADFERTLALIPRTANDRWHGAHRTNLIREMAAYAEAFARLLERHPEDGSLWTGRGRYYLLRDQWDRAASDFAIAVVSAPPRSEEWDEHAALRLLVGDVTGYRAFVREIIRREGDTRDPTVGFVLARACNLSPEPVADPDQVVRWAELGTTAGDALWYKNTLGVAQFRAGRYREAIRTLERVAPGVFQSAVRKLAMAMAYHRLGEAAKARALLDEARAMFEKEKKRRVRGAVMVPSTDWAPAHVYLREAEARILYDPIFPADPFAY